MVLKKQDKKEVFSVDVNSIDTNDILDIKKCLELSKKCLSNIV